MASNWAITISCKGVRCGRCGAVLLAKPKGASLKVSVAAIDEVVVEHIDECTGRPE